MQIVRKDIAPLHISLDITLEPSDYLPAVESELKKFKNQAQLKGFRKGKTPESVIKKMYGKSILADVINKTLQDKLFGYLDEEKINYLGQPLPDEEKITSPVLISIILLIIHSVLNLGYLLMLTSKVHQLPIPILFMMSL
jgi:FKBP-type peptidyl-prolyl cis-trans isomerase (trigger factor)